MKKLAVISLLLMISLPLTQAYANQTSDCKPLKRIFGNHVKAENTVCRLEIERKNLNVSHMGMKQSPEMMELSLMANFENVDNRTAIMGEFALLEQEVNSVIDALRKGGIEVSALHNHMMGENPRILYLHFQGMGDVVHLAETVKFAINKTSERI